jgi:hypothetical protein
VRIQQGHRYSFVSRNVEVLALENGSRVVQVAEILSGVTGWPLGRPFTARVGTLKPLPMRYFHGEVPR